MRAWFEVTEHLQEFRGVMENVKKLRLRGVKEECVSKLNYNQVNVLIFYDLSIDCYI